ELRQLEPAGHVDLATEGVVVLLRARLDHVVVPEDERTLREVERLGEALGVRRRRGRIAVDALDRERRRLAWLPIEVVLADRAHDRPVGQRYVSAFAEDEVELTVGTDADVRCSELGQGRRTVGMAEALADRERELLARVHVAAQPIAM